MAFEWCFRCSEIATVVSCDVGLICRVASVRFVPCDSSCDGVAYIWQGVTQSPEHANDGSRVGGLGKHA